MANGYQLRSTSAFDHKAEAWAGSMQHWDDLARSYDYRLVRNPYTGDQIAGTDIWAFRLEGPSPITLYYHIDEEAHIVTMHDLFAP